MVLKNLIELLQYTLSENSLSFIQPKPKTQENNYVLLRSNINMRQKTMSVVLLRTRPLLKIKVKLLEQVNEMSPN